MDLGLGGKIALVMGGATGIGAGIARALAREGASVALADINLPAAQRIAQSIGSPAMAVACNVTERAGVKEAIRKVVQAHGTVHILVNNVGITVPNFLTDVEDEEINKTFAINCRGHILPTLEVIPLMQANRWGRLIYIGSGSGMKASAGLALYSASKYFIRGLAAAAGLELGKHNITANVICPSDVYPEGPEPAGSWANPRLVEITAAKEGVSSLEEIKAKRVAHTPMRRSCTVEDVSSLAVFLASEQAGFINAQTIGVNGGLIPT